MELSKYMKSIIDMDRASVVICNLDHKIIYMNPAAVERYEKRGGKELIGRNLMDCHNEKSKEIIQEVVAWFGKSAKNNMIYKVTYIRKNYINSYIFILELSYYHLHM